MEDINMGAFDADSYWTRVQGEVSRPAGFADLLSVNHAYQTDQRQQPPLTDPKHLQPPLSFHGMDYQQRTPDPFDLGHQPQSDTAAGQPVAKSPWHFPYPPWSEDHGMVTQGSQHPHYGSVSGGYGSTPSAFDSTSRPDYGLDLRQIATPTAAWNFINEHPGLGGQHQDGRLERDISFPLDPALQSPATDASRSLPTVADGAGQGVIAGPGRHPGRDMAGNTATLRNRPWAYACDVVPADLEDPNVVAHLVSIKERLDRKGLGDFRLETTTSSAFVFGHSIPVHRYILPERLRQDDRARLAFMQVFNGSRHHNSKLPGYEFKMVQVFEPRQFHTPNEDYQAIAGLTEEDGVDGIGRFTDQDLTDLAAYNPSAAQVFPSPEPHPDIDLAPLSAAPEQPVTLPTPRDEAELPTTQRSRPIPKPARHVKKNALGKFECAWPGCTDDPKSFVRKCEWNKHMDKHERPYKCAAEGCEKLSGFTYSGGLLRHEREVHDKHGGPRNPLNCPHANCKRYKGKGFSRLENLNEHLRRVHTNQASGGSGEEAEDGDSVAASETGQILSAQMQFTTQQQPVQLQQPQVSPQLSALVPLKRALEDDGDTDLQTEVKRLRQTKDDLFRVNADLARQLEAQRQQAELDAAAQKQELEAQKRQIMAMMAEMTNMRQQLAQVEQPNEATALLDDTFS